MSGAERSRGAGKRGPSRRRIAAFVALWASISAAALVAPGCYGRNCEGAVEVFGADAGEGIMLDENTWASGPMDGTWLWFPRQRYYIFDIRALGGRTPEKIFPYISGTPDPIKTGNFTIGAGNLAQLFTAVPNRIDVKNDSCSDLYLRLVVEVPPFPPEAPEADAGAEAGIVDASVPEDAEADAGDGGDAEAGP